MVDADEETNIKSIITVSLQIVAVLWHLDFVVVVVVVDIIIMVATVPFAFSDE